MDWLRRSSGRKLPVHTVYLGGGTPSLLPAASIARVLERIQADFSVAPNAEISMEANPGTLTEAGLSEIHACGVNRLSLGMQAAQERLLEVLGRIHGVGEIDQAVAAARQAGFEALNLDLIYGIPTQTMADWEESLQRALAYRPEHLSLYALTLEGGVPLADKMRRGELPPLDDDLAAEMYEMAEDILAGAGYEHYEISNWAKIEREKVHRCRHNLQYWENGNYLGIGAGAHGSVDGVRIANTSAIQEYIERLAADMPNRFPVSPASVDVQQLTMDEVMNETMMLGLRLTETGVSVREFEARYGLAYDDVYPRQIEDLIAKGLLERTVYGEDGHLRLTKRGRLLGNQVFMAFV